MPITSTLSPASPSSAATLASRRRDGVELVLADVDHGQHRLVGEQEVRAASSARWSAAGRPGRAGVPSASDGVGRVEGRRPRRRATGRACAWRSVWSIGASTVSRSASASSSSTTREVLERVGRAGHVVVVERPQHEHDGVDLADVGEERLPRPSPLLAPSTSPPMSTNCTVACTTLRLCDIAASRSSRSSGTLATPDVGVLGGEGVRRGQRAAAGEGVVQRLTCRRWGARRTRSVPCGGQANGAASRNRRVPQRHRHSRRRIGCVTPAEALDRVVHCLDRAHDGGFKAKAFVRARDDRPRPATRGARRAGRRSGTLTELDRHRRRPRPR